MSYLVFIGLIIVTASFGYRIPYPDRHEEQPYEIGQTSNTEGLSRILSQSWEYKGVD